MAQLDLLCLVILALFAIYGFFKGFFTQAMSLLAIVFAYIGAPKLSPGIEHFINGFVKLPDIVGSRIALLIAGLAIFMGVQLFSKLVHNHVINSLSITKYANRFLGFLTGIAKGVCVIYLLYVLISWHPDANNIYANTQVMTWIEHSPLQRRFAKPVISKAKQKTIQKKVVEGREKVEKKVTEHIQSELANQSLDQLLETMD
ncbi:CvpA family protein [bacterium]|nr:CvpA family protein [bacterium]